ncbi:hypothetical protein INT45_002816 [Circinella minor]|uniref:F-box domain-containing protein n=1 Tax=Circinella minor TaxID=1195481 RepID=A0A8H7VMN3_9FUNG|nr:hypothetical protein INT45_002816 [Circinella minor]
MNAIPIHEPNSPTGQAIQQRDFDRLINETTQGINLILNDKLVKLLDQRSYGLGMKAKFELALQDAHYIVKKIPNQAIGYLRMGGLYELQGKQLKAINTYDKALTTISSSGDTGLTSQYTQVLEAKKRAVKKQNTFVDFISILPIELTYLVFQQLSQETKSECLTVSSGWRKRLLEYPAAWKELTSNDTLADNSITSALPYIAKNVEVLSINTTNPRVCYRYLENMQNGHFNKLKSLRVTESTTQQISSHAMTATMSIAFFRIGAALLTTLDLDLLGLDNNAPPITTLADVLSIFPNLSKLVFKSSGSLQRVGGNVAMLHGKQHLALNDLDLRLETINKDSFQPFVTHCPRIRRLVMIGCLPCVFRPVQKLSLLKIFSYNYQHTVSELEPRQQRSINPYSMHKIYTNNSVPTPAKNILPLVSKHMKTLETVYLYLDGSGDVPTLSAAHAALRFRKIKSLSLRETSGLQPLFLHSIYKSPTLTHLCMIDVMDYTALVDTLIELPALKRFQLFARAPVDGTNLMRLFNHYSTLCNTPNKTCSLHALELRMCFDMPDSVLNNIANITSLTSITLDDVKGISSEGVYSLIKALCVNSSTSNLSSIRLMRLHTVRDDTIIALSKISSLKNITLEQLSLLTDHGITELVNGMSSKKDDRATIESLTIKNCYNVHQGSATYARRKIKDVVFELNQANYTMLVQ